MRVVYNSAQSRHCAPSRALLPQPDVEEDLELAPESTFSATARIPLVVRLTTAQRVRTNVRSCIKHDNRLPHFKIIRRVLLHPKGCMPQSNFQISYSLPAIPASNTVEATKYEAV